MKRTTISKDVYVILQKTILVFSSYGGEIKVFRRSLEAIDCAFARKNAQLQIIFFQNTQKMVVQQDIFLQNWQDVGILSCSSSTTLRLHPLQFLHSNSL